jgi:uncharacterized SAM-binding protein YcdF (DUF218 family)
MTRWRRALVRIAAVAGMVSMAFCLWLILDLPLFFDRLLIQSEAPFHADAIVCVAAGLTSGKLPTDEGWQRIHTAVQLYADGYAPILVTSGGGAEQISEAEVYADAAVWLGVPRERIVLDPYPNSTAEQPASLLKTGHFAAGAPLNVVTTALHSRRVALTFKKAGFTNVRVVTSWVARQKPGLWQARRSTFAAFKPSGKSYADIFNRVRWKLDYLMVGIREAAALTWYRVRGRV